MLWSISTLFQLTCSGGVILAILCAAACHAHAHITQVAFTTLMFPCCPEIQKDCYSFLKPFLPKTRSYFFFMPPVLDPCLLFRAL